MSANENIEEKAKPEPAPPPTPAPAREETPPTPSAAELADLRKKAAERDDFHAKMLRALADYQNLTRRLAREQSQMEEEGLRTILGRFLGPLDDLDRVLAAREASAASVVDGARLALKAFLKALSESGVEPVEVAPGAPFNPQEHESVGQIPAPQGVSPGAVAAQVARGYRLRGGKVLRAARVMLAAQQPKGSGAPEPKPAKPKIWTPGGPA